MIGTKIGHFRITGPLGRGGIATVWRARDEFLHRDVALKVLADDIAQAPKSRQRFVHEARLTAMLNHPGIITIHVSDESHGRAYIAYALIDGQTVTDLAAQRLLPIAEVLRIACAAADALGYAHEHGVIHRDVTGRNIMVARDGRVILLDFGLALASGMSRLTSSGNAVGTVAYMAPEAAKAQASDERSDLYGLGVVIYEMLTGRFPFGGERPEAMLYSLLNETPRPPSAYRPGIPAALDAIVLRAIARDPPDRFPNARELLSALQGVARRAEGDALPPEVREDVAPALRPSPSDAKTALLRPGSAEVTRPDPLYLVVLPFEVAGDASAPAGDRGSFPRLEATLEAALGRQRGIRVVAHGPGPPDEDVRTLARRIGANAVLRGFASVSGSRLRASWTVVDPESGVQWAGDVVDGPAALPFEVEDRLVESVRRALGLPETRLVEPEHPRPRDPAARERFARAQRYLERYDNEASVDGAIAILESLIASEGESAELCAWLARACLWKHRLTSQRQWKSRAEQACAHAAALDPGSPAVLTALGDLHRESGRLPDAIDDYRRALRAQPDLFEAVYGLSWALELSAEFDESEDAANRLPILRPSDWRGHHRIAVLCLRRGDPERAIQHWEAAIRLAPDNARIRYSLGNAYYRLDRFDEALEAYQESVALQPNDAAYSNIGTTLWLLGKHGDAIEAFEKAIALTQSNPDLWGNLGNACRWLPGREARAAEALDRAIGLMQERVAAGAAGPGDRARLADWLAGRGRKGEALEIARDVLSSSSLDGAALLAAGHVMLETGNHADALRLFGEAVRAGYGVEVLRRSLAFRSLRDDPEFRGILEKAPARERPSSHHPPRSGGPT